MGIAWTFLVPLATFIAAFTRPQPHHHDEKEPQAGKSDTKPSTSTKDEVIRSEGETAVTTISPSRESAGWLANIELWFLFHVSLQVMALILTIPGMIIAFNDLDAPTDLGHRNIGIVVISFGYFQGFVAVLESFRLPHILSQCAIQ